MEFDVCNLYIKQNLSNAYNSLGDIYKAQGKIQDAVGNYTKALEVNSSNYYASYHLAVVYTDIISDQDKAIKYANRAKEILQRNNWRDDLSIEQLLKELNCNLD